jgi:4'-phosphopantetheinyl transferase EntD
VRVIEQKNPAVLSARLGKLFPAGVVVAELREPGDPALLFAGEAAHLGRAVPKRVQEFAAGRLCARRVLAEFGQADFPVKAAKDRQPLWPQALVGSITHTTGFCAAAAAEKKLIAAIGIDSELAGSVKTELWPSICTQDEINWLRDLPQAQQAAAATLIFTAKEAFYKCQYPLAGERLRFHDATVEIPAFAAGRGAFKVHPNKCIAFAQHAPMPIEGQYLVHEHLLTAGVVAGKLR